MERTFWNDTYKLNIYMFGEFLCFFLFHGNYFDRLITLILKVKVKEKFSLSGNPKFKPCKSIFEFFLRIKQI